MSVRRAAAWAAFVSAATAAIVAGVFVPATWSPFARLAVGLVLAVAGAAGTAALVGRVLAHRLARLTAAAEAAPAAPAATSHGDADDPPIRRLDQAIGTMGTTLHTLLERERSFTRYASHELRTPVSAIKVQLERVDLGAAGAADVLPAVARQTARIEELLDALLTLARARGTPSRVRALREVLQEPLDALEPADRARAYVVEPVPDVAVRDATLVAQALRNLVGNALTHADGPVTLAVEHDGTQLAVYVRDMGAGIPAAELRRLADPFANGVPRPDGHGVGLTLVALIARALDGRLLLRNTEIGLEATLTVQAIVEPDPGP